MKTRSIYRWLALPALALVTLVISGCSGASQLIGASWPGVSIFDKTIYLAQLKVYALDESGTPKWSFPDQLGSNQAFFAAPAADDKLVVVTDYDDAVYALSPADGKKVWAFKSNNRTRFIGGAVLGDKFVYAATADGVVHAINRDSTGDVAQEAWSFPTEGGIWSAPLLADSTLYVTSLDRHVYALDAETGKLQWKFPDQTSAPENPPMGGIVGTPTLHQNILYFGSFNNHLYALDVTKREVLWRYDTTNWVWGSPVVDEKTGYVIAADLDGHIFALDPASSTPEKPVWTVDAKAPVVGSPVLRTADDGSTVVYVTSGGEPNLFVLNAKDGSKVIAPLTVSNDFPTSFLFIPTGTNTHAVKLYPAPVFTDDTLLVATHEGDHALFALDGKTLTQKWKLSLKDADTKLTAAKGQPTDQQTGLFSNPINTLLIITAVFLLVSLVLRPQGGKK